jgi:hypothetical protein
MDKMMNTRWKSFVRVLIVQFFFAAHADEVKVVIFAEAFNNPGYDAGMNTVEWHANYGSNGTAFSETNSDLYNGPIISGADFIIYQFNSGSPIVGLPTLVWTEKTEFSSLNDISHVGVSLYSNDATVDLKIALKVSGSWYVSQQVVNGISSFTELSVELRAINWSSLSFVPGTVLSEGGSTNFPFSGRIQAVGLFDASNTAGHRVRIDDFTLFSASDPGNVLDLDFTSFEGFSDGVPLNGIAGMNAQSGWVAADTAGTGHAICGGDWQRARSLLDFTLEVYGAVRFETTLRLSSTNWPNNDVYYIGFAEHSIDAVGATPSIGAKIHSNGDGSYWFGDASNTDQRISIPATASNDWIKFTQTITRSGMSNEFIGTVSATNLTAGTDLGSSATPWTQTTSDGSWGGTMNASFRSVSAAGVTMDLDHCVVSTINPPVRPRLDIDVTRRRSIGGVESLDRHTWFGIYHESGYGSKMVDGKKIDEWIYEEGRMWPSRGTIGFAQFPEDPARPSFADPASISNYTGGLGRYVTAKGYDPDHKTVFSGSGNGEYANYMCWPTNLTHGVNTVSNHVAHGEVVVRIFDRIQELGGLIPKWYEVANESSIQSNFGWHWDSDAWDKLAEYHLGVANAMHASTYSNSVKVAGPTDAYPFRDDSDGDFSAWENRNKKFVHLTGDRMDAYSMHAYEQSNGKSSYQDNLERYEVWHLGRLPAFLDLWENEQVNTWGNTLPFIFSEYGLLTNPGGNADAYWELRSCNGILLSLLDRPDIIDKMSVFIPSWSPYNVFRDDVMFKSDDGGISYHKTSYFEYLRFWHDLEGDYLFSHADSHHLMQRAFLSGGTNLFVVMQNNYKDPYLVDVQAALPAGADVVSAQMQRIYHASDDVARDPFAPLPDLGNVQVGVDETVMLKIKLSGMPTLSVWEESNHYADRTLVPMLNGIEENFTISLPSNAGKTHSAGWLNIGLYAFEGFSNALQQVSVNGTALTGVPDLAYTAGAPRHWVNVSLRIPEGVLQDGSNTVTVTPAEGDPLMKITSVRLTSEAASDAVLSSDRDLDGMSDAWEIANNFDPSDFTDGMLDSDSDGFDNAVEYVCGTDPYDDQSFLVIGGTPTAGSGFRIMFRAELGRIYAIESTDDLKAGWCELTNGISGGVELIEIMDVEGRPNRFYRIKVGIE